MRQGAEKRWRNHRWGDQDWEGGQKGEGDDGRGCGGGDWDGRGGDCGGNAGASKTNEMVVAGFEGNTPRAKKEKVVQELMQ